MRADASNSRALKIVCALATLVALVMLGRMAVFMADPSRPDYSYMPWSEWEVRHSCLSSYYVAAQAAGEGANVYDEALYSLPNSDPTAQRKPRLLGPFRIDVYEYPPPFLLLPRLLRLVAPDFTPFRALWFGLNLAVILLGMWIVARSQGLSVGKRALLLSPLLLASLPTLSALQKGNVQLVVVVIAMLAMVLFERRQFAAGGALLAFATVSKLYPGMLVVYLLARRQWRAAAWTVGMGVAFALVALLDTGLPPYAAFLDHLPRLLSGEAFPAFRVPSAMAINYSIPGIVFKLKLFGVQGMGFGASKLVGWAYTLVALWATVEAGRRTANDSEKPLLWLAVLVLATLRSPFLPQAYGGFPPLWLLILLGATYAPTPKTLALILLGWLALNLCPPLDAGIPPRLLAVVTCIPQALTVALAVLALRRKTAEA
jgi:hypothetical protein